MTITEEFEAIAGRIPTAEPKVTPFPSGAVMLDMLINGVPYCAEFLPKFRAYGLSATASVSPFWEGVEESFATAEALESRIRDLLGRSG